MAAGGLSLCANFCAWCERVFTTRCWMPVKRRTDTCQHLARSIQHLHLDAPRAALSRYANNFRIPSPSIVSTWGSQNATPTS